MESFLHTAITATLLTYVSQTFVDLHKITKTMVIQGTYNISLLVIELFALLEAKKLEKKWLG